MASIPGAAQRREPRSGGKMVHPRRTMLRTTPYDRPRLLNTTHQNPNWISRHIFSLTRAIVSGATRVLSSVFGFESSSSSSSSSSDCGSTSDDTGGPNDGQDVSSQGLNNIERDEPQSFAGKIEAKCLIEQLLMQESFSREECDKLTDIIKSRVVDSPMIRGMGIERLNETPNRAGGSDVDNHGLCGTAVIEAKRWLEEKKSGSKSKSELHHGTSASKFVTLAHSIEGEAGSPVDMAKIYMRTRPPWASHAMNDIEFRSPPLFGVPLFKEETPYSIGSKHLSSSKRKKDSPTSGSWNIQEEIRKVRSKATEEMLRTLSSPKIDWSSFAEENNLESSKKSVEAYEDLATRPGPQIPKNALNSDGLPMPASPGCEDNQVMEAVESIEGKRGEILDEGQRLQSSVDIKTASNSDVADVNHFNDTNGSILQFGSARGGAVQGSQIEDKNCATVKEVAETGGAAASAANRLLSSGYSMSDEVDKEQNQGQMNKEENTVGFGDEIATRAAVQDKSKPMSEASIEVAVVNEIDVAVSNSQNCSSMQREGEDSLEQLKTPKSKRSVAGKNNTGMEKQQGKKVSRNTRRGRGRVR
ncbi:hypothetical protein V6N13_107243 [Hibiscus sabdariffa]|uniref:Protein KAKU4 n=1 Tax=Hibiscus sabdariffa TaxID=183260 RepID=A0ABR2SPP2_9ROSI